MSSFTLRNDMRCDSCGGVATHTIVSNAAGDIEYLDCPACDTHVEQVLTPSEAD